MPPIHPILVHFPVSLVTVSLGADVVGRLRPSAETRALGFWCLVVAVVGAAGTVAAGFVDMYRADLDEATHLFVHLHRDIGLLLLARFGAARRLALADLARRRLRRSCRLALSPLRDSGVRARVVSRLVRRGVGVWPWRGRRSRRARGREPGGGASGSGTLCPLHRKGARSSRAPPMMPARVSTPQSTTRSGATRGAVGPTLRIAGICGHGRPLSAATPRFQASRKRNIAT